MHPGQRAQVLPGVIGAPPERASVPQGAFLPQSVVQDGALLTPLVTERVEIHGCLQLQRSPQSSARPAAAASEPVWAGSAAQPKAESVKAEIHIM